MTRSALYVYCIEQLSGYLDTAHFVVHISVLRCVTIDSFCYSGISARRMTQSLWTVT